MCALILIIQVIKLIKSKSLITIVIFNIIVFASTRRFLLLHQFIKVFVIEYWYSSLQLKKLKLEYKLISKKFNTMKFNVTVIVDVKLINWKLQILQHWKDWIC